MIEVTITFDPATGSLNVNAPLGDHLSKMAILGMLHMAARAVANHDPGKHGILLASPGVLPTLGVPTSG